MEVITLFINTDGGSRNNPGKAAIGFVIKDAAGNVLELCGKYLGVTTNNVAEYQAVHEALKTVKKKWGREESRMVLKFFMDSQLVVNQLNGEFKIKNLVLNQIAAEIKKRAAAFKEVHYYYIPRAQNSEADSLVNKALDERIA